MCALPQCGLIHLEPRGNHQSISQGRTVLTTALDGSVQPEGDQGLWVYQTRMLSRYQWRVNGKAPTFSALSAIEQHRNLLYYIFAPPECEINGSPCDPAQQAVELRIARSVGEGMDERVTLTNHTQMQTSFQLELEVAADFADHSEMQGPRKQKGDLSVIWDGALGFDYKISHEYSHQGDTGTASLHRGIRLRCTNDQQQPEYHNGVLRFRVRLKAKEQWGAKLLWTAQMEGADLPHWAEEGERRRQSYLKSATGYRVPAEAELSASVLQTLSQSAADLAALRLFDLDGEAKPGRGRSWVPAAGMPIYVGFFGRDTLFTGRQTSSLSGEIMRGSLEVLSHHVGDKINDWRDEQPGRMVHELHTGPLSALNYTPHGKYFGTVTGSSFYPSLVAELWRWTGDRELVLPFLKPAIEGLRWADRYSRDDSGFYKYQTRSTQGEKNQGWKDSGDAIVYGDGSQVPDPLGTCEMQSYIYASKMALAEVLEALGEQKELTAKLRSEAGELKKRFNDFFWMADENYIAMGIDSHNQAIRSVASDPGHCLLNGIVDVSLRKQVGQRLLAEDMFSGWGVRTLSAQHPAYNPFSYHCGSVWPVENGLFVMALANCGLHEEMGRLAKAIFESAALFQFHRLPECFAGHPHDPEHPFPGLYPKANSPQAWSASAPFLIIQAMLGIEPHAPEGKLLLDPHLPEWLPELYLTRLRVADATVDLRFVRDPSGKTSFHVIAQQGRLQVAGN